MLITPTKQTLKRYGLSLEEWQAMADEQNHACYVCCVPPKKGRLCIDHQHVRGWKKMPPEKRKLYVRGLLCFLCNTQYLGRGITIAKAHKIVEYLERFNARMPQ
jgi:hypothetical protein